MKTLKPVENIGSNLKVILRLDTDLPIDKGLILDNSRLKKSIPTIRLILERNNKIVIIGHRGRPTDSEAVLAGKPDRYDENLSLKPVYLELMNLLEMNGENIIESVFVEDIKNEEKIKIALENNQIIFIENIRFWKEEDEGDVNIFNILKKYCSVLVNDAIAVAHRENASIILHREMETFYGFNFIEEIEGLEKIFKSEKPMTIVLGGAKEDKLKYLKELEKIADNILVGGKLPKLMSSDQLNEGNEKVLIAKLREDGLDLSENDINDFIEIINRSKTIIWSGAMGFYEDEKNRVGTEKIASVIAKSEASYKVIAGGDTLASIKFLGLKDKIDFVCSGGGVLLEFLTKRSLPAWN
ncbi:MAG: phosphoglycerate kinase [Candidatus Shapirobacteria bacterium]|nr:phosphoglycerate kinase [Candidatus Shapirobacteria bacterium]